LVIFPSFSGFPVTHFQKNSIQGFREKLRFATASQLARAPSPMEDSIEKSCQNRGGE
jgi:hypothetical protein